MKMAIKWLNNFPEFSFKAFTSYDFKTAHYTFVLHVRYIAVDVQHITPFSLLVAHVFENLLYVL